MNMANWRLIIEGKNITHINWRGKATHYNFENIKIKVCSNLTIKVYEGNRKVIVIDSNMKNLSSFYVLGGCIQNSKNLNAKMAS